MTKLTQGTSYPGSSSGPPSQAVTVAVYNFTSSAYPARPNAVVVRWIGPTQPPAWTSLDEWREYAGP